jgi:hypothetical protein
MTSITIAIALRGLRTARRAVARVAALACAAVLAGTVPITLHAQQQHVLIITGLGGEAAYRDAFFGAAVLLHDVARQKWNVADSSLIVLTEDPTRDPKRFTGKATKAAVGEAFLTLSRRVKAGDVLFVFLHGHGSGQDAASAVNLSGPDPTAADFATWLSGFAQQTIVFVNAASASGDYARILAGPRRTILTATKSSVERNDTRFATYFVRGLSSGEADANKDDRITVLEAFAFAQREVVREYETDNRMLSEHAVLSDSTIAATVAFGGPKVSADPRVAALVAERQALEQQVAALRSRKAGMAAAAYEAELERLLVAIAEKTQAIRSAGGTP